MAAPLSGRRVIVTREEPGLLADLLADRGATMLHLPLIRRIDPADGGEQLRHVLAGVGDFDWLVVTSPEGARRTAAAVRNAPGVRVAAVGRATSRAFEELSGRSADVVPGDQRADALADAIVEAAGGETGSLLLAQADLAADTLAQRLRAAGFDVSPVIAYRTFAAAPDAASPDADAVLFASGSAVRAWVEAYGTSTPGAAVAIGPSTAAVAAEVGVDLAGVASRHSLDGLVDELERLLVAAADDA
jgi:uroporphyrinogen-III synthase